MYNEQPPFATPCLLRVRRGPLWAYSCFACESMNPFIKPLVHGTHHAMGQIGCATGLCFGLANYTKTVLQKSDISRNSKRLLQSLAMQEVVELLPE